MKNLSYLIIYLLLSVLQFSYGYSVSGKVISVKDGELEKLLNNPILKGTVEILPRMPYQEAAEYQKKSDVLFLIQPDFPLQIPRKLYEYIAFQKPVLGITNSNGATAGLIRENILGIVVNDCPEEIGLALESFYLQWKKGLLTVDKTSYDEFLNRNLSKKLLKIFQELS